MRTLHCTAALSNSVKSTARFGQALDVVQGRIVVRKLLAQIGRSRSSLHREHVLTCCSNGDSLQVAMDKQKISIDLEPQAEGEYCMPGEVLLDNESDDKFTILRVEVKDYPGLLRVCAWVLNGLQLTVQNARYSHAGNCSQCHSSSIQQHLRV